MKKIYILLILLVSFNYSFSQQHVDKETNNSQNLNTKKLGSLPVTSKTIQAKSDEKPSGFGNHTCKSHELTEKHYTERGILEEFKRAYAEIKEDQSKFYVWQPILNQYPPAFLSQCENAITWSENFVRSQLEISMFKDDKES